MSLSVDGGGGVGDEAVVGAGVVRGGVLAGKTTVLAVSLSAFSFLVFFFFLSLAAAGRELDELL